MTGIAPLILLWLAARAGAGSAHLAQMPTMPSWPTAASPPPAPPPLAAFQPQPTNAESGTPLPDLHTAHEIPQPANAIEPAQQAVKKKSKVAKVKSAAAKLKSKVSTAKAAADSQVATVANLQSILNARGAKLKKDGLYGPKTATAWGTAAKRQSLPSTIAKVGPTGQLARVSRHTFEALKTPPAP